MRAYVRDTPPTPSTPLDRREPTRQHAPRDGARPGHALALADRLRQPTALGPSPRARPGPTVRRCDDRHVTVLVEGFEPDQIGLPPAASTSPPTPQPQAPRAPAFASRPRPRSAGGARPHRLARRRRRAARRPRRRPGLADVAYLDVWTPEVAPRVRKLRDGERASPALGDLVLERAHGLTVGVTGTAGRTTATTLTATAAPRRRRGRRREHDRTARQRVAHRRAARPGPIPPARSCSSSPRRTSRSCARVRGSRRSPASGPTTSSCTAPSTPTVPRRRRSFAGSGRATQ